MRMVLAICILCSAGRAQELQWSVYSLTDVYSEVYTFGDLNGDGFDDLLCYCFPNWATNSYPHIRVLSGRDGAMLDDHVPLYGEPLNVVGVGDFDGDGYPDYAMACDGGPTTFSVEVWSPHRNQQLLLVSRARGSGTYGGIVIGGLDLDGDHLPDLVVGSTHPNDSDVYAYDHWGTLLYTIPVRAMGGLALSGVAIGDVTGDACDDYVIGGIERYSVNYGFVATVSGRTGALVRVLLGEQPHDDIGYPLCVAGDVDRDGKVDYAASNYWGAGRSVLNIYSGATGAILQQWTSSTIILGDRLVGGRDIDLDGVPDVIGSHPGYPNSFGRWGRVHAFSTRDRQILMHTEPSQTSISPYYGRTLADLGVQPGSPYPVFALTEIPSPPGTPFGRIEAWRCSPVGTQVIGSGCTSNGIAPTIGVRPVEQTVGQSSRIVLGSAPPGSFAWCLLAPASANTFGGVTLPLALDPIGFVGCDLLVPPTSFAARQVGTMGFDLGYAEVNLSLPMVPSGGSSWAAQWFVMDPTTLGYSATARHQFRVQ